MLAGAERLPQRAVAVLVDGVHGDALRTQVVDDGRQVAPDGQLETRLSRGRAARDTRRNTSHAVVTKIVHFVVKQAQLEAVTIIAE